MAKPDVLIFTPTEEESRSLAESLDGVEFEGFIPRVLAVGPGREPTRTKVTETAAPLLAGRNKPLLLIGVGRCRPLDGGLKPGEITASGSVVLKGGGDAGVLTAAAPLVQAVIERLAVKGFRTGRLLDDGVGSGESRPEPGCLAADAESAGLALAAADLSPELAWLNLRMAAAGLEPDDYLEALNLKLLVALSTIDQTPPPSACSGCRNPCNIFKAS